MAITKSTPAPLTGGTLWCVTIALSLATFMQMLDSTISNVAIPTISGFLGASTDEGTWVITSFGVANAIAIPVTGRLAQRIGELRLFLLSVTFFSLSSLMCSLSTNLDVLIFFRVVQGLMAGPLIPLSQSLLLRNYPPEKRTFALALWSMTVIIAPICGPILGGYICDNFSWGWIFLINVPMGIIVLTLCLTLLKGRETETSPVKMNLPGLTLLVLGVGGLQIMLDKGRDLDWFNSSTIIILTVVSVISLISLVIWESTSENPILDLSLFKSRNFTIGIVSITCAYLFYSGAIVLMPQLLQETMGYNAIWAGLAYAPIGIMPLLISPLLGLTGTELGTLYSVNQFTSILFMMFYGIVQDKLGLKKPLIWCMSFILVLTGPFMIYVYEPLLQSNFSVGLILGALFFGLGYLAGCGLLDSFTEKMARNFHFEYGTARAWGSFGYAIGAFFAGIFFSISPHINFWLVSLFGAVFMMINMRFKDKDHQCIAADAGGVKKEDFIAVFKDRNFWVFVIFIVGTWSFYNIFDQQLFPVFYAGLFESHDVGTRLYGYLNSFQVVLEALCMAIIPFFVNRVGPKNALLIGVVIMALRILSCALFVNPWIISLVKLLHAIEVPLCVISVFKYSVANFDKRLSSTIFLIGFQIASSLGIVLLSTPTGILFDHAGYQTVFFAISGIVCLMLLFGIFFLSKKREQIVMETPVPSAI
ncbi:oligosaccharide MFS transporter [Escherichia coli]|nr:oligosaccharide MFS transporter [Escherichia coli]